MLDQDFGGDNEFSQGLLEPLGLIHRLIVDVPKHIKSHTWTRGEGTAYTIAVKEVLRDILRESSDSLRWFYTNSDVGASEFLLDFVGWDTAGGEGAILGCESEWYSSGQKSGDYARNVGIDFEKLLVFKAPLKLLIFASLDGQEEMQMAVVNEIARYLKGYKHHLAGETYLILDFAPQKAAWTWQVTKSGKTFERLSVLDLGEVD